LRLIRPQRQQFPKEEELIQAEARLREERSVAFEDHPSRSQLNSLAGGEYPEGDPISEALLSHLHDCDSCLATMAEIRRSAGSEQRNPTFGTRKVLLVAAGVLVLAVICFWAIRGKTPSATIATVDLREITRGHEASSIVIKRSSRGIRLLLPGESASADYQVGIFSSADPGTPITMDSARSTVVNGDTVIVVTIPLRQVKPGPYLLGLRHGSSEWKQYAITIE
jgi:hypothetical protein